MLCKRTLGCEFNLHTYTHILTCILANPKHDDTILGKEVIRLWKKLLGGEYLQRGK